MSGPSFASLFPQDHLPALGPGRRREAWSSVEVEGRVNEVTVGLNLPERRMACLHALALLWHDHLEEGHALVQDLSGVDAAFVHGIMHRREPDFSNARYWFHRVGDHPALELIADAAAPVLSAHAAVPYRLIREGKWDPFAYIDAVSVVSRQAEDAADSMLLRELQGVETLTLARHLTER